MSSDTCITCRKLEHDLQELRKQYSEIAEQTFYCVLLDESNCKELFAQYDIEGAPALLKYVNGIYMGKLYEQITQEQILAFVQ